MHRQFIKLALGSLCMAGLMACAPGSSEPVGDQTLLLSRLSDGSLEYCDQATGECYRLPYDGGCNIIEITIDTTTGQSCQRCIMEDGTVIDSGCVDVSVQCVVVTIPDPDCIVCAYVNGDVIFSTCTVAGDPECVNDRDCEVDDGMYGYCLDGQCIYDPGCREDRDCPAGFQCLFYFADGQQRDENGDGEYDHADMPYWGEYGTCVPMEQPCENDYECPVDMYCMMSCWDYDCGSTDDYCGGGCEGVCVPFGPEPSCEDVHCPPGTHCEMVDYGAPCGMEPDPDSGDAAFPCFEPYPECVPDFGCSSDADCWWDNGTAGQCINGVCIFDDVICDTRLAMCEMLPAPCPAGMVHSVVNGCFGACVDPALCAPMECADDFPCPADFACEFVDCYGDANGDGFAPDCYWGGVCVPEYTRPTCEDIVCPDGQHCELLDVWCFAYPCDPQPVCVRDLPELDCNPMNALCDMIEPTCPAGTVITVVNGCYGGCVDPSLCAPMYCGWDADCPAGFVCEMAGYGSDPTGADSFAAGICVAESQPGECWDDSDCPAGFQCMFYFTTGQERDEDGDGSSDVPYWEYGICVPAELPCETDADCPSDQFCAPLNCDPAAGINCGGGGVCLPREAPPPECFTDADCPDDMACELMDCFDPSFSDCGGGGVCVPRYDDGCFRTGCSGQICADEDVITTCEWLSTYACYDDAVCERQADGACGWTMTNELAVCLDDPDGGR